MRVRRLTDGFAWHRSAPARQPGAFLFARTAIACSALIFVSTEHLSCLRINQVHLRANRAVDRTINLAFALGRIVGDTALDSRALTQRPKK